VAQGVPPDGHQNGFALAPDPRPPFGRAQSDPLSAAQDSSFDRAHGKRLDGGQGRSFGGAHGKPDDGGQDKTADGGEDTRFDGADGRPFDGADGKPRVSFLLVTIPSDVARGVVARSVAALSKRPNRLLGYVENMSGYYCRDCDSIKPLFESSGSSQLEIPCLGAVPFDPELARHCDRGMPLAELRATPVGRALDEVAQQLLNSLGPATPAAAHPSHEPRPGKERR
jgi:hypothetical protein